MDEHSYFIFYHSEKLFCFFFKSNFVSNQVLFLSSCSLLCSSFWLSHAIMLDKESAPSINQFFFPVLYKTSILQLYAKKQQAKFVFFSKSSRDWCYALSTKVSELSQKLRFSLTTSRPKQLPVCFYEWDCADSSLWSHFRMTTEALSSCTHSTPP